MHAFTECTDHEQAKKILHSGAHEMTPFCTWLWELLNAIRPFHSGCEGSRGMTRFTVYCMALVYPWVCNWSSSYWTWLDLECCIVSVISVTQCGKVFDPESKPSHLWYLTTIWNTRAFIFLLNFLTLHLSERFALFLVWQHHRGVFISSWVLWTISKSSSQKTLPQRGQLRYKLQHAYTPFNQIGWKYSNTSPPSKLKKNSYKNWATESLNISRYVFYWYLSLLVSRVSKPTGSLTALFTGL